MLTGVVASMAKQRDNEMSDELHREEWENGRLRREREMIRLRSVSLTQGGTQNARHNSSR